MRDVALLRHRYVLPAAQRVGVGARLVKRLEQAGPRRRAARRRHVPGNSKARRALEKAATGLSRSREVLRPLLHHSRGAAQASLTYEKRFRPARDRLSVAAESMEFLTLWLNNECRALRGRRAWHVGAPPASGPAAGRLFRGSPRTGSRNPPRAPCSRAGPGAPGVRVGGDRWPGPP